MRHKAKKSSDGNSTNNCLTQHIRFIVMPQNYEVTLNDFHSDRKRSQTNTVVRHAEYQQEAPRVFACQDLWQHELPLLQVLKNQYGERPLDSFGGSYGWSVRYRQLEDYAAINIRTLGEYLDAFQAGETRLPYLRHLSLNRAMPELRKHIHHPQEFGSNWVDHPRLDRLGGPELFIGQQGTMFGHVHQDQVSVHVGFVQLQGEKEFVLFPPEDGKYLDIFAGREFPYQLRNSRVRYADLQDYSRFPLLRKAHPQRIRLTAGEALLLPADWWHTTRNISDSVSYSIRIVNATNVQRTIVRHLEGFPRWLARIGTRFS
jgi:hypothetical protein